MDISEKHTGIYTRTTVRATTADDMGKGLTDLSARHNDGIEHRLDQVEAALRVKEAQALLAELGATFDRGKALPKGSDARMAEWTKFQALKRECESLVPSDHIKDPDCRAEFVRDVTSARGCCLSIRHLLASGQPMQGVNEAILLGTVLERIGVRPFEHVAEIGQRLSRGQRRRHEKAHGTAADKQAKWAKYRSFVDDRMKNPGISLTEARKDAANHFHKHYNTIKNHTKNLQK